MTNQEAIRHLEEMTHENDYPRARDRREAMAKAIEVLKRIQDSLPKEKVAGREMRGRGA